ncbi:MULTISPECIES: reverse transcriptase domain-containing protein [Bacillus cereus group]|uniref:Group II intron reverse transcriptase/maturase n=1 Tax=Bacillus wiedmannii TaxID=1890302 RepID=A0A2B5JYG9_9BACI|nr:MULTISPECIES: reverse transcriptase domain-containing protein [Bacillus cereus group]PEL74026.1 group II intron reverse transcriptase/maturase [Bacillus wiedmannii]PER46688.1 group II intron reverse transcriptase/maturase [Bacillus thuringiensis]PFZ42019.1 group II intron reverse transcriptase/maturase [Bacillus wiedmannii]PGA87316.1 group II intron reverse transcriptase/maturase [Bacillus wiedmannii]PGD65322.1 group II intron reverse transcriptase/maturase [Bacillus wiedmannii]
MQCPKVVLSNLRKKSLDKKYQYTRLYRNLYNPDFFLLAYNNLSKNDGALTMGVDQRSIDGFSMEEVEQLIEVLKNKSYQPYPSKRVYIPKKNGKKRPLGIPSFCDKLVQEVIRMILEAIYEPNFSNSSHAYRKNKSCHSALLEIKRTFTGSKWFIEGDIRGFFDNIEHHTLMGILRRKISDENFIELIWKFLRAGYLDEWKFHNTYSGAPQGGIISPILSNIYLNELDVYMESFKNSFNQGKRRKKNPEYENVRSKMRRLEKKIDNTNEQDDSDSIENWKQEVKVLKKKLTQMPYSDQMDNEYRRLTYVRYADDFLIGIIGSKEDAQYVKEEIANFLKDKLKLELSMEKTLITNASNKQAQFLGYEIKIFKSQAIRTDKLGRKIRLLNGKVQLKMPHKAWVNKLQKYQAIQMSANGTWKPKPRNYFQRNEDLEIVSQYNSEIRGLYNYYRLAENVSNHMHRFAYFMFYSMLKTFATKYRKRTKQIRKKYMKNGRFTVEYETKRGIKQIHFIERNFPRINGISKEQTDVVQNSRYTMSTTRLSDRIKAETCESCGRSNTIIHMHHVKRLKNLREKSNKSYLEQQMIARNRKTIALCKECHLKRHKGEI